MSTPKFRPAPIYTKEQLALAIELATGGASLRQIVSEICSTEYEFWVYKQQHPSFLDSFDLARQEGLEHIADLLLTIADDVVDVQRGRLKSDNYKWLLSKRKPATYGDKIDLNINQTIDIGTALRDARSRVDSLDSRVVARISATSADIDNAVEVNTHDTDDTTRE